MPIDELHTRLVTLIAILEGDDDGLLSLGEMLAVLKASREIVWMYRELQT